MVKYAAAGLNLNVGRNQIISEGHKTAKQKVQGLHVAKTGTYLPVDRSQADIPKLHNTSNKLLTKQTRIMKYKVSYLGTCLQRKWNSRSHL
jgi:hypothetical protein